MESLVNTIFSTQCLKEELQNDIKELLLSTKITFSRVGGVQLLDC